MTQPTKRPFGRLPVIIHGLLSIASGLVIVFTLGQVSPGWTLEYAVYVARKNHRKRMKDADEGRIGSVG